MGLFHACAVTPTLCGVTSNTGYRSQSMTPCHRFCSPVFKRTVAREKRPCCFKYEMSEGVGSLVLNCMSGVFVPASIRPFTYLYSFFCIFSEILSAKYCFLRKNEQLWFGPKNEICFPPNPPGSDCLVFVVFFF